MTEAHCAVHSRPRSHSRALRAACCRAVAIMLASSAAFAVAGELPESLARLRDARSALASGTVHWSQTHHLFGHGRELNYISRYARNGDRINEMRGDAEGWVEWGPSGSPVSKIPQLYLVASDSIWHRGDGDPVADLWRFPAEISESDGANPPPPPNWTPDLRWLGIAPSPEAAFMAGADWFAELDPGTGPDGRPGIVWSETRRGRHVELEAAMASGTTIRWTIAPDKDWNAEQIVVRDAEGIQYELVCELAQFGEIWFPHRVTLHGNGVLATTVVVHEAQFNQPGDPEAFEPADIGIEPAFNVSPQNFRIPGEAILVWDGDTLVTIEEWKVMVASGLREAGPTMQARRRGEINPYYTPEQVERIRLRRALLAKEGPATGALLADWERYVRDFIVRHQLDADQTARALDILQRCQRKAHAHLDRHADRITRAHDEAAGADESVPAHRRAAAEAEIAKRIAPLGEIFENELKPRLDALLTDEQRKHMTPASPAAPNDE